MSSPADNDLKRIMRGLSSALVQAIAASGEAADAVREARKRGYSIHLVLDRHEGEERVQVELSTGTSPSSPAKPDFLLNKGDVTFLESVGIDATRRGRRRRTL